MAGILLMVFGALVLAFGLVLLRKLGASQRRCSQAASAEAVSLSPCRGEGLPDGCYDVTLRFHADGKDQTGRLTVTRADAYPVGSRVEILYNPNNPIELRPAGLVRKTPAGFYLPLAGGGVLLLAGLVLLLAG